MKPIMKQYALLFSRLFTLIVLTFPFSCWAHETKNIPIDLSTHVVGYVVIVLTVVSYIVAMIEDVISLRKSKPMVLGSALIWFIICVHYALMGDAKTAAVAFESNLLAYAELFLFILVSMTYLNTMKERGIFDALRFYLLDKHFSYRQLFWITGSLAFLLSMVVNGLTVGLLMGSVVMAVGRDNKKFVSLACINIVVASNAGGTVSPLGGISTLFVWQHGILSFIEFFALTLPCVVNFLVPALFMNLAIPKEFPLVTKQQFELKRGSKRIVLFFALTLLMTVASNILLDLPPAAGMMAGLSLLEFFNYYLTQSEHEGDPESERSFDIFKNIGNIDWDTLLFFYGAMMIIGAVGFVGYLDAIAHFLFGEMNITLANVMIGLSSAFVDNGTLMFAVLSMHPDIANDDWLQLTLTLGVGGSLLAIGSATGVGLLGQVKAYTFEVHLRWFPVILLSYFLSVATQIFISSGRF